MSTDPVQRLMTAVRADLREALHRRDPVAVSPLREIMSMVDNANAVDVPAENDAFGTAPTEVPRREVTITEVMARLRDQVDERLEAAATYRNLGELDRAQEHAQAAAVIASYLPDDS